MVANTCYEWSSDERIVLEDTLAFNRLELEPKDHGSNERFHLGDGKPLTNAGVRPVAEGQDATVARDGSCTFREFGPPFWSEDMVSVWLFDLQSKTERHT